MIEKLDTQVQNLKTTYLKIRKFIKNIYVPVLIKSSEFFSLSYPLGLPAHSCKLLEHDDLILPVSMEMRGPIQTDH